MTCSKYCYVNLTTHSFIKFYNIENSEISRDIILSNCNYLTTPDSVFQQQGI